MKRFAWILTLAAFCLGCNLIDNGVHTLVVEPYQYCAHEDEHRTHIHDEKLAGAAWAEFCKANPGQQFPPDFACGFQEGYADFLDRGGTAEPPPLPPRTYWNQRDCRQGAVDWSDGFHAGAQLARRTGLRQVVVVPTDACCINQGTVPVYCAPCQQQAPPIEAVPPPMPVPQSVPSGPAGAADPAALPAALPAAPMPPHRMSDDPTVASAALSSAPLPPQLSRQFSPGVEAASTTLPLAADANIRVEIFPPDACFLNDSCPSFPDDVKPFFSNEISGCSHESR